MKSEMKLPAALCEEITTLKSRDTKYLRAGGIFISIGLCLQILGCIFSWDKPLDEFISSGLLLPVIGILIGGIGIACLIMGGRNKHIRWAAEEDLESRRFLILDDKWYELRDEEPLGPIKAPYLVIRSDHICRPNFPKKAEVPFSLGQTGITVKFQREGDPMVCYMFFKGGTVTYALRNLVERKLDDLLYLIRVLNTPFISSGTAEKLKQVFRERLAELGPDKLGPYRIVEIIDNIGDVEIDPDAMLLYQALFPDTTPP